MARYKIKRVRKKTRRVLSRRYARKKHNRSQNRKKIQAMHWRDQPFPPELVTTLTYGENVLQAETAGVPDVYYFTMNDLYDPNSTGSGNKARYYNTLLGAPGGNAPYGNYMVFASKIKILITATGTDTVSQRALAFLFPANNNSSSPTNMEQVLESREGKKRYLGYWGGGTDHATLSMYSKVAPWVGVKDLADNPNCTAVYNAHPGKLAYWCFGVVPLDESSSYTYRMIVTVTYYVKLFGYNRVATST